MKPRTSFSSSAAVHSSSNTCGGIGSSNNIFSPMNANVGPVKEGIVSQIASKFQQQVVGGVLPNSNENEKNSAAVKRKISEPVTSGAYKYAQPTSQSGDTVVRRASESSNFKNKVGPSTKENQSGINFQKTSIPISTFSIPT